MSTPNPAPARLSVKEQNDAAMRAMTAGDYSGAREILKKALLVASDSLVLWLNLASCCGALGDVDAALEAVEGALRAKPRAFRALLMKGTLLDRKGDLRRAASAYGAAIGLAPPADQQDQATAGALQRAREVHTRYLDELSAFISGELGPLQEKGDGAAARRINTFVALTLGRKRNYRQEPSEYFYPGLPAVEFHEREEFPWLPEFEAGTAVVREELLQILKEDFKDFVPYIDYPEGLPLDQWAQLNHSKRWGAMHLQLQGEAVVENTRRCPQTMKLIGQLPQPHVPRRSPASLFSALQPKTRIPPHTGVANTRLVVHLPLIVPPGCGFRVGNETRQWREGTAWVFDDTIEHEAWNDSDQPRVILICDIWNPRISTGEQQLISAVMSAMDKFNGVVPDGAI